MISAITLSEVYIDSFSANIYTLKPFRMIGLIDVGIDFLYGTEKVTLAFFRSSGTNSGKIRGLWYPIVGIKTVSGEFSEFSEFINYVLKNTTKSGTAKEGWLAKSLFFSKNKRENVDLRGFSNGSHHDNLLKIGFLLKDLYSQNRFRQMDSLDEYKLNSIIFSDKIYKNNTHSQKENYERFINDVFGEF